MGLRYEGNDLVVYGSTFRTTGTASSTQGFLSISNLSSNNKRVIVLALEAGILQTGLNLGRTFQVNLKVGGAASGGTAIATAKLHSSDPANVFGTGVTILGATASDGGGATAITNPATPTRIWGTIVPSGLADTADVSTQNWALLPEDAPPVELEPGDCLSVIGDVDAASFAWVNFVLAQTR